MIGEEMLKGNALIGQSGGPTAVINASLVGVVEGCKKLKQIKKVYGMRFGIEGVLGDFLLDLTAEKPSTLKQLRMTPSSALGSSRHKLKDPDFAPILAQLRKYDIRYLFMIGGNDTMDTIHRITEYARSARAGGYEMIGVGIPKTVDNDLFGVDHTPGYPSAARYVAMSVQQGGCSRGTCSGWTRSPCSRPSAAAPAGCPPPRRWRSAIRRTRRTSS